MDITTMKAELEGTLHGTTTSKITNLDGIFNRGARQLLLDIDPQETKRITQLGPIYDSVYDYSAPSDLKGNKIIDIRPQNNRTLRDRFSQQYSAEFDINKNYTVTPNFNVNFNTANKTLRIDAPQLNTGTTINNAESLTANGTWAGGTDASNLSVDNINFIGSSGSISCDLSGATGIGYLENSNMTPVDLTTSYNQGSVFFYVYLPVASRFTSINLRWGSSSTVYYTRTLTTTNEGTAFQNGWNLMRADWYGATPVGTPDYTKINYLKITYNYSAGTALTGTKLDQVVSRMGTIMEVVYYSKDLFRDAITGAFQETVTDDSNQVNLDTETYNLYFYLVSLFCTQQMVGQDATYDTNMFQQKYNDGIAQYKRMYKSEVVKPKIQYYRQPVPSWRKYFGRSYNY